MGLGSEVRAGTRRKFPREGGCFDAEVADSWAV